MDFDGFSALGDCRLLDRFAYGLITNFRMSVLGV
jgi:hypothetical protein